jgi:hypothetical protein
MAGSDNSTRTPLSHLFRDPALRAIFARAERDNGSAFLVPVDPPKPTLPRGEAVETREAAHVVA